MYQEYLLVNFRDVRLLACQETALELTMKKKISQYDGQCVRVDVGPYPNLLTWTFEDGTQVQTSDLDLTERSGRHLVAAQAERFGFGDRGSIEHYLRGRYDEGPLFPMNTDGLDDDAGFPVV